MCVLYIVTSIYWMHVVKYWLTHGYQWGKNTFSGVCHFLLHWDGLFCFPLKAVCNTACLMAIYKRNPETYEDILLSNHKPLHTCFYIFITDIQGYIYCYLIVIHYILIFTNSSLFIYYLVKNENIITLFWIFLQRCFVIAWNDSVT